MSSCDICIEESDTLYKCKKDCTCNICTTCLLEWIDECIKNDELLQCVVSKSYFDFSQFFSNVDLINPIYKMCSNHYEKDKYNHEGKIVKGIFSKRLDFVQKQLPDSMKEMFNVIYLSKFINKIKREKLTTSTREKKQITRNCGIPFCLGTIENNICNFCNCRKCEKCYISYNINKVHVCKKEDIESVQSLKEFSSCPTCSSVCERISGCKFLTCAACKTNFHCEKLTVESEGGHTDKFYDTSLRPEKLSTVYKDFFELMELNIELFKNIEKIGIREANNSDLITLKKLHISCMSVNDEKLKQKIVFCNEYSKFMKVLNNTISPKYGKIMIEIQRHIVAGTLTNEILEKKYKKLIKE